VLGKLHNLCIYSRSSTSIYNDFKAEIGRALPRDNDTRWNSWFHLIDVAIENRAKFMHWIQENHAKIEKDALDHNDWNELGDIHAFLQVFHQISVRQGRENTLDEVLSHMDFLHHHFTRTKNRAFSGPRFYARFHVAWLKFEKYYQLTEQAPVYVAGILLHPALRKSYLSEQWKRNPAWVSNAVKAVRKIWSTEYKSYQLPDKQQEKRQELDEFDRWRQKVYSTASAVKDEFDRFIYVSNLKPSNGLVLTILRRAHRLGLDNKRPYSGGLNRPSERISPSSAVWLLTYSASPPCLRKQSESSQAQDGRLDGIEVACLPKW
ncbi:Indoleamine 2,3-dioxygenase, partial [Fusarium oxysporum f. sp. albedinis]